MKKFRFVILFVILSAQLNGQFIWEEDIWTSQARMILNNTNYNRLIPVVADDSYVFIWEESEMGSGDLFGHKYSPEGGSLWAEPVQLTFNDRMPYYPVGISDEYNNTIIAYFLQRDTWELRLLKVEEDGEIEYDISALSIGGFVYGMAIKKGAGNDFYIGFYHFDMDENDRTIFYHFDEDGNITDGWENGLILSQSYSIERWDTDVDGNIVVIYNDDFDNILVQRVNQSGELELGQGVWLAQEWISPFYMHLAITPSNDYVCGWGEYTFFVNNEGEVVWDYNSQLLNGYQTRTIIAGENHYYALSGDESIYQYNYDHELMWSMDDITYNYKYTECWIREDDGIRFLEYQKDYDANRETYRLLDYNAEGELISPEEGWYSKESYLITDLNFWAKGNENETIWLMLDRSEDLNQELKFAAISEEGEIISGVEPVVVREGMEHHSRFLGFCVFDGLESMLMFDDASMEGSLNDRRAILQQLDSDGEALNEANGEILYEGRLQLVGIKDGKALMYEETQAYDEHLYLLDMETGEDLWGEEGFLFNPSDKAYTYDFEIVGDVVTIYWSDADGFKVQRIQDGEELWTPGGVYVEFEEAMANDLLIRGHYLINHTFGSAETIRIYVSYINDDGFLEWSHECGYNPGYNPGYHMQNHSVLTENGLLVLFRYHEGISNHLRCHLISESGEFLYGDGFDIPHYFDDQLWGIVKLEDGFGVISNNQYTDDPAIFSRYDMEGNALVESALLNGTGNCLLTGVEVVEDGLIVFMTTPDGAANTMKFGYYDFNGNLMNINGNNPITCYEEFCDDEVVMAEVYENTVYMAWQSVKNRGSDVLMQGWEIPATGNDEPVINEPKIKIKNYPNPFNPETTITFSTIDGTDNAELAIYNIKGQRVREFKIENAKCKIEDGNGRRSVVWDGKDELGKLAGSGIYFVRLKTGGKTFSEKIVLMK